MDSPTLEECSLHSNLSQCLLSLRQLEGAYQRAHPLVKALLQSIDDRLAACLPAASGNAKKLYPYILDMLNELQTSYNNRLTLYFNVSPYWQHYVSNMNEITATLIVCCNSRANNGRAGVEFQRKFKPIGDVMRRRLSPFSLMTNGQSTSSRDGFAVA